jgi:hypothetical protein
MLTVHELAPAPLAVQATVVLADPLPMLTTYPVTPLVVDGVQLNVIGEFALRFVLLGDCATGG